MVTSSFHNRASPAVAHPEPFAGSTVGKQLTAGGPIEAGVPEDHLIAGIRAVVRRHQADASTVHAFTHIVVGFPFQAHVHALHKEGTEALTSGPSEGEIQLAIEAAIAMPLSEFPGQTCADASVCIDDLD